MCYTALHVSMPVRYLVITHLLRDIILSHDFKKKSDRPTRLTVVPLVEPQNFFLALSIASDFDFDHSKHSELAQQGGVQLIIGTCLSIFLTFVHHIELFSTNFLFINCRYYSIQRWMKRYCNINITSLLFTRLPMRWSNLKGVDYGTSAVVCLA